ncbi:MAG: ribonuclease III [Planctomycetes bacterium]|nr:ribonuclease III [Planctomycetota bacterium]
MVSKKPDDTKKPTKRAAAKRGEATTKRSTSTKRSTTAAPVTDQRLAKAQERLGYAFKNLDLLTLALCHSSTRNEGFPSNERLEFLGDAVLSLLVSWFLYEGLPDANEGELSARRVQMTRGEHLATIAERIGLSQLIRTGKNQDLEPTASMQSDLIEACLGAIFLDGGLDAAQNFVLSHVIAAPKGGEMKAAAPEAYTDAKSQLQHFTLARRLGLPEYREVSVEGPAHAQMFTMEVLVADKVLGTGSGSSKKTAQQAAAQQAFDVLREAESRAGPANGDDAGDGPEDS